MTKLKDLWISYQRYTTDLNTQSRTVALGAGGLCWMFKEGPAFDFPRGIQWAMAWLALYFFFDVLYAFTGAILHRVFTLQTEARLWAVRKSFDTDIPKPRWLDRPVWIIFCLRTLALFAAFIAILVEFYFRFKKQ